MMRTTAGDVVAPRLLSSERAARYLGLGSRWAVRRLIVAGEIPALKLAGKLMVDRQDLDDLIERLKGVVSTPQRERRMPGHSLTVVPAQLAPLPSRPVTAPVTRPRRRAASP